MSATTPTRMTAEEFLARPETELGREELIGGELVVMDSPGLRHQHAVRNLVVALANWAEAAPHRGEATLHIDTYLDDDNVLEPDLQWFADGRDLDPDARPWPLGDLVIEVRSPSTWHRDVGVKRELYERHGTRELWLVDPISRTVLVFRRSGTDHAGFDISADLDEDATLTSPLLPDFALAVGAIFD